ncbi:NADPH-dependent FMN reductase [Paenibacillus gansuensis]|uniref:NADPH-dependent FMN reductase n=1 Tax=Paenibacillus gansuensis TaxID=306542 RepID=A0ABW5PDM6_9BACL
MKIALLSGAARKESSTAKLMQFIAQTIRDHGHEADLFNLQATPVPFYSNDEPSDHEQVIHLRNLLKEADAIVLGTPEYHGGMTGVLKNALDFVSAEQFDSKAVLAVSSAGGAVGTSSLLQIQAVVRNLHGINCPEWISIGGADQEFGPDGEPANDKVKQRVLRAVTYFLNMAQKL